MATYKRQRYLFMTLDPVHIGTGGYRLGRVDNTIVREPGTNVPKIPGTSLHGAARFYAAQLYETPEAAGQKQDKINNPDQNPVCYTFGYIKNTTAYSGVVNVFDAHIIFFPVHSMAGPVWVSTIDRLDDAGFKVLNFDKVPDDCKDRNLAAGLLTWERTEPLNLGWLMIDVAGRVTVAAPRPWETEARWRAICDHIVLVKENLFSQVVNSNLEVRTSVAIDPARGAAEDKALFTYEAIPRATFLTAEIVLDDYRDGTKDRPFPRRETAKGNPLPGGKEWGNPLDVLAAGLRLTEWLGVGGMGTRGFGRIAIVGNADVHDYGEEMLS